MVRRERDTSAAEPASWGEAIQEYARSKATRPRPESEYQKPFYVTQYQKSREATEYHPILQTFRETQREDAAKAREASNRVTQLNAARDKQIALEQPFDILNMSDKRSALPQGPKPPAQAMLAPFNPNAERPTFRHPLDSCYQYNIVSNLPLSDHHFTAPALRPKVKQEHHFDVHGHEKPDGGKPRLQHVAALPRDFNILSNRYVEQHDAKVSLEREIQRRTAAQKYWETHDYEPVVGHYLEPEKEAAFQEHCARELSKQPMKSFNRLPPSLQKGEGFVYDITTHQVKNAELYEQERIKEAVKIERNAASWDRNESMRNQGLERQVLADQRAINRQSHQRYQDSFRHGFNIVDHRDYRDPETYIPPSRTRPEPTLWQTVGPNPPPPPPPVPSGPWAERTFGRSQPLGMSATAPAKVGGLQKLAEYEARAAAAAPVGTPAP